MPKSESLSVSKSPTTPSNVRCQAARSTESAFSFFLEGVYFFGTETLGERHPSRQTTIRHPANNGLRVHSLIHREELEPHLENVSNLHVRFGRDHDAHSGGGHVHGFTRKLEPRLVRSFALERYGESSVPSFFHRI